MVGEGVTVAREVQRIGADALLVGGALAQEFCRRLHPGAAAARRTSASSCVMPPYSSCRPLWWAASCAAASRLQALAPLRLALTVNPFRVPQPFQPKVFFSAVAEAVGDRVPMFDACVNGSARLPGAAGPIREPPSPPDESGWPSVDDALRLNGDLVDRARAAANEIADDIQQHIEDATTDTTERATLRLLGIAGVNEIDVPLVNVVAEHARDLLPGGIMRPFVDLMEPRRAGAPRMSPRASPPATSRSPRCPRTGASLRGDARRGTGP